MTVGASGEEGPPPSSPDAPWAIAFFLHIKRTNRGAIKTDFEEPDLNIE